MRYLRFSLLVVSCLVCASAPAQKLKPKNPPAATPVAAAGMTNDDVIALASAGLPDEVITAKIHAASSTAFDTSITGLKALKAGGVSGPVIRYMIDPSVAPAVSTVAAAPAVAAPPSLDDPNSPHTPGVYILASGADGKVHMTKLDHITPKNTKTSGAFLSGMTYGIAKAHVKASIDGGHATVQTTDEQPVFYAYIPEDNNSFGGASISVRDLTLIRFDAKESNREVNTATISPWGSSTGTDAKAKQGFASDQIKSGVYKMTLDRPLPAGQYAFQHQNYGAFFDFGIIPAK